MELQLQRQHQRYNDIWPQTTCKRKEALVVVGGQSIVRSTIGKSGWAFSWSLDGGSLFQQTWPCLQALPQSCLSNNKSSVRLLGVVPNRALPGLNILKGTFNFLKFCKHVNEIIVYILPCHYIRLVVPRPVLYIMVQFLIQIYFS